MISLELYGSFSEMGQQHGESVREALVELAEVRTGLVLNKVNKTGDRIRRGDFERLTEQLADEVRKNIPQVGEEMDGVARGANVTAGKVLVAGGYTDVKDVVYNGRCDEVDECTTLIMRRSPQMGAILGGTWDTHGSAQESLAIVRRKPSKGPSCIALTSVGWPAQQGVNEEGIIFGTNNLVPTSARIGLVYIAVLAGISMTQSISRIVEQMRELKLASGHFYTIGDKMGSIVAVETTADKVVDIANGRDIVCHTNHYLAPELLGVATPPTSTSLKRLARIESIVQEFGTSDEAIWRALSDHEEGEDCICRHGIRDEPRSCAAYVINSSEGRISYTIGPACSGGIKETNL